MVAEALFYLLDVETSNALVIYNEGMKEKQSPWNIVEFKTGLVELQCDKSWKMGQRKKYMPW